MPETFLTTSNVTFAIGIIGVIFTVFFYFRKPQEDLELKQAVTSKDIDSKATVLAAKEMESKAALLAQQVQIERDSNEKKFNDIGIRIDQAFALAQNHLHTLDTKQDAMTANLTTLTIHVEKLSVILDERLPRKE